MRWSRPHADDTSLGELLEQQPDETAPTAAGGPAGDDDTAVRAPRADPGPVPATDATAQEPGSPESFLDDEDYLPQERRGPGRLTIALVAALVLAVGVLGGVWVQKSLGTSAAASAFAARQGAGAGGTGTRTYGGAGAGTGAGTGSAPGGAAPGGAASAGTGGGTGSSGSGSGGGGTSGAGTVATPVVVGTVTSAGKRSLVVTDLGGTRHTVTVGSTTTVTTPYAHGALKAGDTVAVAGSAGPDGAVAATAVTVS